MDIHKENKFESLKEENQYLLEQEEKYKTFINLSSEGIWRCEVEDEGYIDTQLPIEKQIDEIFEKAVMVECNDTMASMYGMKKEEILGIKVNELLPKNKPENIEYIKAFIESGYKLFDAESIEKDNKGNIKYFLNNLVGIIKDGKLIGGWGTQRDITGIKKAEEALMKLNLELTRKNEELLKINNELDNFIYTVTHDLNSPLSNIEGLINVLRLNPSSQEEEIKGLIDLMEVAIERFKSTIKNIAQYTKTHNREGEDTYLNRQVAFSEVLENVKFAIGKLLSETDANIKEDFSRLPTAQINAISAQSILFNLISNAIKYRHPDRVPVISVKTYMEEDSVVIEVQDNGIGFAQAKSDNVFDLFTRLHHHVEGSGIGLYLVKRIAENTGGKVTVESKPGEGSLFKVYLNIL